MNKKLIQLALAAIFLGSTAHAFNYSPTIHTIDVEIQNKCWSGVTANVYTTIDGRRVGGKIQGVHKGTSYVFEKYPAHYTYISGKHEIGNTQKATLTIDTLSRSCKATIQPLNKRVMAVFEDGFLGTCQATCIVE